MNVNKWLLIQFVTLWLDQQFVFLGQTRLKQVYLNLILCLLSFTFMIQFFLTQTFYINIEDTNKNKGSKQEM